MSKWLMVVVVLMVAQACDPPWAGPSLPDGSTTLNLTQLSANGPFGSGPGIAGSTSLVQLRREVISAIRGPNGTEDQACQAYSNDPDPCWNQIRDAQGRVYVAVITNPECTSATKEASAVSGHTLYFIHWIGSPERVCNAAMLRPNWRLYSASRSDLPRSGVLTVGC